MLHIKQETTSTGTPYWGGGTLVRLLKCGWMSDGGKEGKGEVLWGARVCGRRSATHAELLLPQPHPQMNAQTQCGRHTCAYLGLQSNCLLLLLLPLLLLLLDAAAAANMLSCLPHVR